MAYAIVIIATISVLWSGRVMAQSSWSQYKPGSVAALIQQERGAAMASIRAGHVPLIVTSANTFPTLAVMQYQDSTRPTSATHLRVLTVWAKTQGRALDMATLFQSEALFREDTLDLWIPVQSVLIPAFRKELHRGDRAALYVGYVGAQADDSTKIDWVFIVNEFHKQ